jgi:hypothetical protein
MNATLHKRLSLLEARRSDTSADGVSRFRDDPTGYATEVLHLHTLTADQVEILRSLTRPPYKTLVKSGHEVGKTLVAAIAVCWWFDTRKPSIVISTAPSYKQTKDLLWKEVRKLRVHAGLGGFVGPKLPRLETAPDHFAVGLTATTSAGFQGHHGPHVLVVMDEAVGVGQEIWDATHTMAHAGLFLFNPTDTTSAAYQEEAQGERPYTVRTMSQLDHPNLRDYDPGMLQRAALPVPYAVKPWEVDANIRAWCTRLRPEEARATDIEWPPRSGTWWRPGPLAEARILGRWPSQGTYGVWSDGAWEATGHELPLPTVATLPVVGVDVALFGDDFTSFHSRVGAVSLAHESYNGRDSDHTIGRCVQLADQWAAWHNARLDPKAARVGREAVVFNVDTGGIGGDLPVRMREQRLTVRPVNAGTPARNQAEYLNRRSELWFDAAERAATGKMSLAALPADQRKKLRQQALAPRWALNAAGQRVVEPKEKTKEKLGRSPYDLDALNLAYAPSVEFVPSAGIENAPRRSMFGR